VSNSRPFDFTQPYFNQGHLQLLFYLISASASVGFGFYQIGWLLYPRLAANARPLPDFTF
jgi:hypothetical protein